MDFRLLGPLEVVTEAGVADVGSGKRGALLTYLLIHANEVVSTERLIDELWNGHPPATAAKSVQVYVSQLRKGLGTNGDLLVTRGSGYLLRVRDGELDTQRFQQGLGEARRALEDGDAQSAADAARAALALWRGPALYDVAYESFAQNEAARLEELRLVALETRIDAELALGNHGQLVGELEALVAEHPARERFRAQLMLALYRCGRQSDALDVYRRGSRLLREELGLEPSAELRALEQKILTQSDELKAPRAKGRRPSPPQVTPAAAAAQRSRRGARLVLMGGALLAVAATLALLGRTGGSGPGQAHRGDTVVLLDPVTARVRETFAVGHTPTSVAVGAGAVWALNGDDQTVSRIDPKSGGVEAFGVGATPTDIVADARTLWVGAGAAHLREFGAWPDRLLRVDPDRDAVRASIELPGASSRASVGAPGQIAVGAGAIWALGAGQTLAKVDPSSGRVTAIADGLRLQSITVAMGSVWAIVQDTTDVVQIDARTLRVRRRVHLSAAGLDAIDAGAGVIWLADGVDGTLWRINLGGKLTTRTIDVGTGADAVAVGAGAVWAINSLRGTVVRVDPRRNRVTNTISVRGTPRDLAIGAGGVWVADAGSAGAIHTSSTGTGQRALPRSVCGRIQSAGGAAPDRLIVSDLPLDPSDARVTQPMANAVAFVLRQHHFRAGRYRLGYQSCDDSTADAGQWDAGKCTANARAYAAAPAVLGVVGPLNSGCATVELPILNRSRGGPIAVVSPTNDVLGLTRVDPTVPRGALGQLYPTGVRNYVRLEASERAEAAAAALLARRLGLRRVYVLDDGETYGLRNAALFRSASRALGVPIAGAGHWNPGGTNFAALASRIRSGRADGIYLGGLSAPPVGRLIRTLRARVGAGTALIAPIGMGPIDFEYEQSRGAAVGLYVTAAGPDAGLADEALKATSQPFVHDFGATQPGVPVTLSPVYAAAATEVLIDAIARSDGTRASVTHALLATRLQHTAIGAVSFDRNGDVRPAPVTILRVASRLLSSLPYGRHARLYGVILPPERLLR